MWRFIGEKIAGDSIFRREEQALIRKKIEEIIRDEAVRISVGRQPLLYHH